MMRRLFAGLALLPFLLLATCVGGGAEARLPRGININVTSVPAGYPADTAPVDYYAGKGLTIDRLNIDYEKICPTPSGALDQTYVNNLRAFVDRAHALHVAVMLDLHNYARAYGVTVGAPGFTARNNANCIWRIGNLFKDAEFFSLNNEPHQQDPGLVLAANNAAIGMLRVSGYTGKIGVMPASTGWPSLADPAMWVSFLGNISDPANNWFVEMHIYFDTGGAGQSCEVIPNYLAQIDAAAQNWRNLNWGYKPPIYAGEIAWCAANNDNGAAAIAKMEAAPDVFAGIIYWGNTPSQQRYPTGPGGAMVPYIFKSDPGTQWWDQSATAAEHQLNWSSPDKPQMQVLVQ